MSDIVSPLLQWLNANPEWAGFVTFLISASESVAIIGTIVPGSITMTAIGALAGAGIVPLWATIIWAIFGAVVGDGISYWIGHYFKDRIRTTWPFRDNPGILQKGEYFVHKYGVMSVFIGRFVGPLRAMVPVVDGMLGMRPLQFTIANIASAIGWAPAYMLPGILLGAASLELPPEIALHVILALLLIFLFIILCCWLTYKILQLLHNQIDQLLNRFWNTLKQSRYFHITTVVLKHCDPAEHHHGQLTLAFYFLLTSFLFVALIFYVKLVGPQHVGVNDVLYHLTRGIRTAELDNIMLALTTFGQKTVVLPIVFAIFCWLLYIKRTRAALHALALGVLAAGSVFVIKHIVQTTRPWGIFNSPASFSMPSGHTTLSTTIYMGIALIIAMRVSPKKRKYILIPAGILIAAIGLSRVYLGAHWFTDVLAGWLLSSALLILVTLSYLRQREAPIQLKSFMGVVLIALSCTYGYYYYRHHAQIQSDYALFSWPAKAIPMNEWWDRGNIIPQQQVSLFGFPSQLINIQWVGNLEKIKATLLNEGWAMPPKRDLVSTLHRIADVKSGEYLPLVSPQYLDKVPVLTVTKYTDGDKNLVVLRLWQANRNIAENGEPLWVGTVGLIPGSYSWLFKKAAHAIEANPSAIFSARYALNHWQWKTIILKPLHHPRKKIQQPVLLIRNK